MSSSSPNPFIRSWVSLLAACSLAQGSLAQGTRDCADIVGNDNPFPCKLFDTQNFNGNKVEVYHYAKDWRPSAKSTKVMRTMFEVSREVLPDWEPNLIPSLHVKFLLRPRLGDFGGQTHFVGARDTCYVEIPESYPQGLDQDNYQIRGNLAHELGHCLLGKYAPRQDYYDASRWILEGQPEYFADAYYPPRPIKKDSKANYVEKYDPKTTLLKKEYTSSLFWHFMENQGWSDKRLLDFMKGRNLVNDDDAERERVSRIRDITEAFPKFAAAFVDKDIKYQNGKPIKQKISVPEKRLSTPLVFDDQEVEMPLSIDSFTFKKYIYTIFPGSHIGMSWDSKDNGLTLLYREHDADEDFKPLRQTDVEIDCLGEPKRYELLLVSTSAKEHSTGTLTLKRIEMQDCPCEPNNVPLDPCLAGRWKLNVPSWKKLYVKKMEEASDGEIKVNQVSVSGSHTWVMTRAKKAALDFKHLLVRVVATSDDTTVRASVDINGHVNSDVVMRKAKGSMCMRNIHAQGRIHSVANGFEFDDQLDDSAYKQSIYMTYKCTRTSLEFSGFYQGAEAWGYIYDRVA